MAHTRTHIDMFLVTRQEASRRTAVMLIAAWRGLSSVRSTDVCHASHAAPTRMPGKTPGGYPARAPRAVRSDLVGSGEKSTWVVTLSYHTWLGYLGGPVDIDTFVFTFSEKEPTTTGTPGGRKSPAVKFYHNVNITI